jgi:hypothetical protein
MNWYFNLSRLRVGLNVGQATKGARGMPWRHGPMKGVARLRKAPVCCLANLTGDSRMGKPDQSHVWSLWSQHITPVAGTGGTETS